MRYKEIQRRNTRKYKEEIQGNTKCSSEGEANFILGQQCTLTTAKYKDKIQENTKKKDKKIQRRNTREYKEETQENTKKRYKKIQRRNTRAAAQRLGPTQEFN